MLLRTSKGFTLANVYILRDSDTSYSQQLTLDRVLQSYPVPYLYLSLNNCEVTEQYI